MLFDYNQLFIKTKRTNKTTEDATQKRRENIKKALAVKRDKYDMRKKTEIKEKYINDDVEDEEYNEEIEQQPVLKKTKKQNTKIQKKIIEDVEDDEDDNIINIKKEKKTIVPAAPIKQNNINVGSGFNFVRKNKII